MKTTVNPSKSSKVVGPYSHAVEFQGRSTIEISGQIGVDPEVGGLVEGGVEAQAERIMKNIGIILEELGLEFSNIVKCRIYLSDMGDYKKVNEVYSKFFEKDYPARAAMAVKGLPLGALVEIECTAVRES